jgi:hypothetical protein
MRFTPIADMIEAMFDNGTDLKSVLLAVRTIEERDAERHTERFVTVTERSPGAIRSARHRAKVKQNQAKAEANDTANAGDENVTAGRHAERHGVTPPCDLSSLLPLSKRGNREENKEENKKETVVIVSPARAKASRGTRLDRQSLLSADDLKFAIDNGFPADRVDTAWAEFIDYWIGVPGSRGTKLDWSATWRNRIRQISVNGGSYGQRGPRPLQDDSKSISAAAGRLREAAERGEYSFGPRPQLLPEPNESPVFLLSKGRSA